MTINAGTGVLQRMAGKWGARPDPGVLSGAGVRYLPSTVTGRQAGGKGAVAQANLDALGALVSDGTFENRLILGDSFLQQQFQGRLQGEPFSSVSLLGLDRVSNEFVEFWADSRGGVRSWSTPNYQLGDTSLRLELEFRHPFTGQVSRLIEQYAVDGESSYSHRMTMIDPTGHETVVKSTSFTRR